MNNEAPLTPLSLPVLLGRIAREWETRRRIFDLPTARFWAADPEVDLSFEFLGRKAATPIGPAAGPHTQMAQNIVLGWLGGARLFELKTVQVLDDLVINRPCIDMETVGYNIEWSQELPVEQSLEEYVKAWMLIEMLGKWAPIRELIPDPGPHVFDMSVGYDLAGISSDKVASFIEGLIDARTTLERLRPSIPEPFAAFRELDFPSRVADTITLSTFHGCPADEIGAITQHLISRHRVDVIVKLNPTLLGFDRVSGLLHDRLGYRDITLNRQAFEDDLQFEQAIDLIGELQQFADLHQRRFGIKLTNTLVVGNHKQFLPDQVMYLSGPPLHVITTALLDRLVGELPDTFLVNGGRAQVSFSAGVNKENISETLGMGVSPATVCTDLLKPGGYGRLEPMLRKLTTDLKAAGCGNLDTWRKQSGETARATGFRDAIDAHLAAALGDDRVAAYHLSGNQKTPRAVDHDLEMWGCVACNFCVTVCPNDAFFKLPTPPGAGIEGRQQYLVLVELCNECGNCLTFCPERGDPALVKPRLYVDRNRFVAGQGQGFLLERLDGQVGILARPGFEDQVPMLAKVLAQEEGLPIRATDL